jgi:phospholipid/cholesterol/gamma-HCH transport system permease protein
MVALAGDWRLGAQRPSADDLAKQVESEAGVRTVAFDSQNLTGWDTGLLTFLARVQEVCDGKGIQLNSDGLPEGARRLLALATAVPERKGARREDVRAALLPRIGESAVESFRSSVEMVSFIGEAFLALGRFLVGKAQFRRSDLFLILRECGADALPIVSLISALVGLILAFVGAMQLKMFGAQIYVADLVGIAMVRVMGAVMTGIIMAGRTGGAFAAQLGTMEVNEEIDALRTLGISPMEFLVLPRMLALILMMPLLGLYADLMGILGGLVIGVGVLDLNVMEYYNRTHEAVGMNDMVLGLIQASIFGILVALSGCLRGMQCGRSASAVGNAATSAVVTAIVAIIVATGIVSVLSDILGI